MSEIPKEELDLRFKQQVAQACEALAAVCYNRIMLDPDNGFKYLSDLATHLDCQLSVKFECTVEQIQETKP